MNGEEPAQVKQTRPPASPHWHSLSRLGCLLIAFGLAGAAESVLVMLAGRAALALALHTASAAVWLAGIRWLARQGNLPGVQSGTAAVLSLCLFPGLGVIACSLVSAASLIPHNPATSIRTRGEDDPVDTLSQIRAAVSAPTNLLAELEVQPLADLLGGDNPADKRAALDLICRGAWQETLSLARRLLADPDRDIQALAAVAVSSLEASFNSELKEAMARRESQPECADHHAEVGRNYRQYAHCGSDPANRQFYLSQARQAFAEAASLEPEKGHYTGALAEVLVELGEEGEAWTAIDQLLAAHPQEPAGYRLGAELALRQRRLDKVDALCRAARARLPQRDPAYALFASWPGGVSARRERKT